MVWFFGREAELLRIETSYDKETQTFLLNIYRQHGEIETETFRSEAACHKQLERLEGQLRADRWTLRFVTPLYTPES